MASASSALKYTPAGEIPRIVESVRTTFASGKTKPHAWRLSQLRAIKRMAVENKDTMVAALAADMHRPELEAVLAEYMVITAEVDHAISHLSAWMADEPVPTPAFLLPATSKVVKEPLGVVLIIGPWNFPLQLCFCPLIAAIAAGNAAVIKPSEVSPACSALLQTLTERYLDRDAIKVVQGAVDETTELLKAKFDHIFYTGNGAVAQIVMTAAAKHLTPVTLELGGKSPTIVNEDADLDLAAKRILVGKAMNTGQACIAPDYLLVHRRVVDALTEKLIKQARAFYGEDRETSPSIGRIINSRHFSRVSRLLETAGGKVVFGGRTNPSTNFVDLTLIREPSLTSPLMQEEIFGPLLPIVPVDDVDAAIRFVNERPKPLALYIFTGSQRVADRVIGATSSGGAAINDVVMQFAVTDLPFGGVGPSGMGAYHGKAGFDALSHAKSVFTQTTMLDPGALRYPPYSKPQLRRLETLMGLLPATLPSVGFKDVALLGLLVAVVVLSVKFAQTQKS